MSSAAGIEVQINLASPFSKAKEEPETFICSALYPAGIFSDNLAKPLIAPFLIVTLTSKLLAPSKAVIFLLTETAASGSLGFENACAASVLVVICCCSGSRFGSSSYRLGNGLCCSCRCNIRCRCAA